MSRPHTPSLRDLFNIIRDIRYSLEYRTPEHHQYSTTQCLIVGAFFDLKHKGYDNVPVKMLYDVTGIPHSSIYRAVKRLKRFGIVGKGERKGLYKIKLKYPPEIRKYLRYNVEEEAGIVADNKLPIGTNELRSFILETMKEFATVNTKPIQSAEVTKPEPLKAATTDNHLLDDLDDIIRLLDEEEDNKVESEAKADSILDSLSGVFQ